MHPPAVFRRFAEVATRRPGLIAAVGLGLVGEAGRVGWGLARSAQVTILGHGGFTTYDAIDDRVAIVAYGAWVAGCGLITLGLAARGWRRRRAAAGAVSGVMGAAARPVVERRRRAEEMPRR